MMSSVQSSPVPLDRIVALVEQAVDPTVVERGRARQAAVWRGEEPDYLILMLNGKGPWPPPQETMDLWHRLQNEMCAGPRWVTSPRSAGCKVNW